MAHVQTVDLVQNRIFQKGRVIRMSYLNQEGGRQRGGIFGQPSSVDRATPKSNHGRRARNLEQHLSQTRRQRELRERVPPSAVLQGWGRITSDSVKAAQCAYRKEFSRLQRASDAQRTDIIGDQIILPAAALDVLNLCTAPEKRNLLVYEVACISKCTITHTVAANYTGDDQSDCLIASDEVCRRLGFPQETIQDDVELLVTLVDLPKGRSVKFVINQCHLDDVPDLQAFLEAALRSYATLTVGDTVGLKVEGRGWLLGEESGAEETGKDVPEEQLLATVQSVEPGGFAISIRDTDIEATIVSPGAELESAANSSFVHCEVANPTVIEFGQVAKVNLPTEMFFGNTALTARDIVVRILGSQGLVPDTFVSFFPLTGVSKHMHHFAAFGETPLRITANTYAMTVIGRVRGGVAEEIGENNLAEDQRPKSLLLTFGEPRTGLGTESAGQSQLTFCVSLETQELAQAAAEEDTFRESSASQADDVEQAGYGVCNNCGKRISEQSRLTHEMHCLRFLTKCPICCIALRKDDFNQHIHCAICNQGMTQHSLEEHMGAIHTKITCRCGLEVEPAAMATHRRTACPKRLVKCRFCDLFVRAGSPQNMTPTKDITCTNGELPRTLDSYLNLSPHESVCGSRTMTCPACEQLIIMKEQDLHFALVHSAVPSDKRCPFCRILVERYPTSDDTEVLWRGHLMTHLSLQKPASQ